LLESNTTSDTENHDPILRVRGCDFILVIDIQGKLQAVEIFIVLLAVRLQTALPYVSDIRHTAATIELAASI